MFYKQVATTIVLLNVMDEPVNSISFHEHVSAILYEISSWTIRAVQGH